MIVKVCGLTRSEDALTAVEAGADLLGFIFAPSPRRVEPAVVAEMRARLPEQTVRVGVFVNEEPAAMLSIARACGLTAVQLHGDEPVETEKVLEGEGLTVIKAIRVADVEQALRDAEARHTRYLLIEPRVVGRAGGTGKSLDALTAARLVAALQGRRVLLAGGLGPDNVADLVRAARPWGVDASSRLEGSPGRKDPVLVKRFVEAARA